VAAGLARRPGAGGVIRRASQAVLRAASRLLVRVFYRGLGVTGRERVPTSGPVLVVANHPNGLLDPLVVAHAVGRPVAFLGKSTFWSNPVGRWAMEAFGAIPVYRQVDGSDTARNEETFAKTERLLTTGGFLALFPEGTSHDDPRMKPLKTGAARMAFRAENAGNFGLKLHILPIGLLFEDKAGFRSRAAAAIGTPFTITTLADAFRADERAAVQALTNRIDHALSEVVLQADSQELWRSFLAVAAWTHPDTDLAATERRALELADAWHRASAAYPVEADRILEATRDFAGTLRAAGVEDPYSLAPLTTPGLARQLAFVAGLVITAPLALIGTVLGAPAWLLVDALSEKFSGGDTDVVSTMKALGGLVLHPIAWTLEALAAGLLISPVAGLAVLVLGPLGGWNFVRLRDRLRSRRRLLKGQWLRLANVEQAAAIEQRRLELAALVKAALEGAANVPRT